MEKVILDVDSFIGKNEEKVFTYKMMKPKFNKQTKKFEEDEIFKVFSKDEYHLLDIVEVVYNKEKRKYEIAELLYSTNYVDEVEE